MSSLYLDSFCEIPKNEGGLELGLLSAPAMGAITSRYWTDIPATKKYFLNIFYLNIYLLWFKALIPAALNNLFLRIAQQRECQK